MRRQHEIEDEANRRLATQQAEAARARRFELGRVSEPEPMPREIVIPKAVVWLGFAAALGLVAWIGWPKDATPPAQPPTAREARPQTPDTAPQPVYVAQIDASVHAQWDGPAPSGDRLELDQPLHLRAGMVQLTFDDGATVLVEAPATFEPTGPNAMRLTAGRLSAVVPPSGYGFRVITPHTTLTDLGTEFGVEVQARRGTTADVFTGRVVVESRSSDSDIVSRRDLSAGQATQADPTGRLSEVSVAAPDVYYRDLAVYAAAPQIRGPAEYLRARPADVSPHLFESTEHIAVFVERQGVAWQDRWAIDAGPGAQPGTPVTSYLVHYDPFGSHADNSALADRQHARDIILHFDRPIVGVIGRSQGLYATDAALGHDQTAYPALDRTADASQRGLDEIDDHFEISDDGHTLSVRLVAGGHTDQLRVLVDASD